LGVALKRTVTEGVCGVRLVRRVTRGGWGDGRVSSKGIGKEIGNPGGGSTKMPTPLKRKKVEGNILRAKENVE